jgi:hypothetical protein
MQTADAKKILRRGIYRQSERKASNKSFDAAAASSK